MNILIFQKIIFKIKYFIILLILFVTPYLFTQELDALDHASISIFAVQSNTGEILIDKNSDLSLTPASCMKIVTTAAALQIIGTDYRFETHLEYDGFIDSNKTLHGNLYIRGGGDPCLGSDRISGVLSWKNLLETWVKAIKTLGIQRIEGKIIGDATQWEEALAVSSWTWEDLGNYYGAGACALSFHENSYSLIFKPGSSIGEKAIILDTDPPISTLIFQNEVKTGPEGSGDLACIYGSEFSNIVFIRGTIPAKVNEFSIKGSIPDPAKYVADLLVLQLKEKGITVEQRKIKQQNEKNTFHITYSPTIGEIVHWTNQKSINLYAEHLLKKMGEVEFNDGSTSSGLKAVTNFLESQGIDLEGFNMADGSGLSRKNLITTKQLVQILLKMKKSIFFPIFFESLPQKDDSTRAKSGTMSLVKGYAGYKDNIAFAILINQCSNQSMMNEKINNFLLYLNQFNQQLDNSFSRK